MRARYRKEEPGARCWLSFTEYERQLDRRQDIMILTRVLPRCRTAGAHYTLKPLLPLGMTFSLPAPTISTPRLPPSDVKRIARFKTGSHYLSSVTGAWTYLPCRVCTRCHSNTQIDDEAHLLFHCDSSLNSYFIIIMDFTVCDLRCNTALIEIR
jgi:hypothetical protein